MQKTSHDLEKQRANFREAVVDWLTVVAGSAAKTVLNCIAINERPDALPLGLAVVVLFHPEVKGRLDKAVGKLEERYRIRAHTPPSFTVGMDSGKLVGLDVQPIFN